MAKGVKPPASPYLAPQFYDDALAKGRHRDIVGGRWDETGRVQLALLKSHGMQPHHRLVDIGAGSLRLGCKAVPYLNPGNYWATDQSRALMLRGRDTELPDPTRLSPDHLIEDAAFDLPSLPDHMDYAMVWGVFPHIPADLTQLALSRITARWPGLTALLFTVFEAPDDALAAPYRQADGVVTHPNRPPRHMAATDLRAPPGWAFARAQDRLPRGQILWVARPLATAQALTFP